MRRPGGSVEAGSARSVVGDRLFGRVGRRLPGVAKDGKRRFRDGFERLFVRFAGGAQVGALSRHDGRVRRPQARRRMR